MLGSTRAVGFLRYLLFFCLFVVLSLTVVFTTFLMVGSREASLEQLVEDENYSVYLDGSEVEGLPEDLSGYSVTVLDDQAVIVCTSVPVLD